MIVTISGYISILEVYFRKEGTERQARLTGYKPPERAFPRRTMSGLTFS
jgi:hypothetical protein